MTKSSPTLTMLVEAFRVSISPSSLAFAYVGVFVMVFSWRLVGGLFLPSQVQVPAESNAVLLHAGFSSFSSPVISSWPQVDGIRQAPIDPVFGVVHRFVRPFLQVFSSGNTWQTFFYFVVGGLLNVLIWSFFGAAITRTAVMRFSALKSIGFQEALGLAVRKGPDVFSAVALPLMGMAMIGLPAMVIGWMMRFDAGVLVAGVLWIVVCLVACLMATLGIGLVVGWPLMWGTICTENSDAFDAISRSYAYVFQRPLKLLLYVTLAAGLGMFGWGIVWCFAEFVIALSFWSVEWGCGTEQLATVRALVSSPNVDPPEGTSTAIVVGAGLIGRAIVLVRCLASAFSFSFFWSVTGAIYLLLRHDTDQTPLEEIFQSPPTSDTSTDA